MYEGLCSQMYVMMLTSFLMIMANQKLTDTIALMK